MQTAKLPCIILAGGKSSRMGRDKSLLPFGHSETLMEYQARRLSSLFESVHVNVKTKEKVPFEVDVIEDTKEFDAYSPLVGLYSILKHFDTPVFVLSVDTPFVGANEIEKLILIHEEHDATLARSPYGSHQMCGIYKPSTLPVIQEHIEQNRHKIRDVLAKVDTAYVDFDSDEAFMNLNHPEEYEEAKKRCE